MITSKHFFLLFFALITGGITAHRIYGQSLQSQPSIDSLQQQLSKAKDDTSKINTLYKLAVTVASNDSAAAQNYVKQCMGISQKIKWKKGIGLSYLALAHIYFLTGDFSNSILYSKSSYDIFKSLNSPNEMARSLLNMGNNFNSTGYYAKAIENEYAALKLYEITNYQPGIRAAYHNIGVSYYRLMQLDNSIENYKKAFTIDSIQKNQFNIACDLDDISIDFEHEEKYDSATIYNLKALLIFESLNQLTDLAKAYNNRASILMELNDAKSAYKFYDSAFSIYKKLGNQFGISLAYSNFGNLYLDLAKDSSAKYIVAPFMKVNARSRLQESKDYLTKAIALEKKYGDIDGLMSDDNTLSEIEERLGNYKAALAFHKEYAQYNDSIFNDENKKKIAALETQRLTEIKNKEIQVLNQQKALEASEVKRQTLIKNIIIGSVIIAALLSFIFIRAYNRRKKSAFDKQVSEVEMKALRSQMNPHFIFNSLNSINRYIVENDKENASAYLSKFSNVIRLILENSREQEVPLEDDLHTLELYMQLESLRFRNRFSYVIETGLDIDKENTLIPPLLLQPFVENSIIHGLKNKEDGLIKISVNKDNNMLKCVVEDNGAGMHKIGALETNGDKKYKSLGMKIISERLNIINQLKKAKAAVNIFDLKDAENKPAGLRVELLLPFELAF